MHSLYPEPHSASVRGRFLVKLAADEHGLVTDKARQLTRTCLLSLLKLSGKYLETVKKVFEILNQMIEDGELENYALQK